MYTVQRGSIVRRSQPMLLHRLDWPFVSDTEFYYQAPRSSGTLDTHRANVRRRIYIYIYWTHSANLDENKRCSVVLGDLG